ELIEPLGTTRWRFYDRGSGGRPCLLSCGRCRIEFAVALLDSPGASGTFQSFHYRFPKVSAVFGRRIVGAPLDEVPRPSRRGRYPFLREESRRAAPGCDIRLADRGSDRTVDPERAC